MSDQQIPLRPLDDAWLGETGAFIEKLLASIRRHNRWCELADADAFATFTSVWCELDTVADRLASIGYITPFDGVSAIIPMAWSTAFCMAGNAVRAVWEQITGEPIVVQDGKVLAAEVSYLTPRQIEAVDLLEEAVIAFPRKHQTRVLRLEVNCSPAAPSIAYDGTVYRVTSKIARFFEALVKADGGLINATEFGIRSAEIEGLVAPLKSLIERKTGAGCWISRDRLWRS